MRGAGRMTTDEGFLRRWARRKQAAKAAEAEVRPPDPAVAPTPPGPPDAGLGVEPVAVRGAAEAAPEEADPALDLPPLESLTASSDFTAFLQKGVSAAVQSRALRVAWESDEAIAGFRGMAEYAWDFNAPDYGKLWATDDVAKLVQQALRGAVPVEPAQADPAAPGDVPGESTPAHDPEHPAEEPAYAVAEAPVAAAVADASAEGGDAVAPPGAGAQDAAAEAVALRAAAVRRHGSALPG